MNWALICHHEDHFNIVIFHLVLFSLIIWLCIKFFKQSQKIRCSELLHRILFQSSPNFVGVIDETGKLTKVNSGGKKMFSLNCESLADGLSFFNLWQLQEILNVRQYFSQALAGKAASFDAIGLTASGGKLYLAVSLMPVIKLGKKVFNVIVVMNDQTDRVTMEHQLRQAQKIEAMSRFAGGVAHEFNNMLAIITGYADLLFDDSEQILVDEKKQMLTAIKDAADRAAILVRKILLFSKDYDDERKVLNLSLLIQGLLKVLKVNIPSHISLQTEFESSGQELILVSSIDLHQVVMNLVANAETAMPNGGILTIGVREVTFDQSTVPDARLKPGAYVMLVVKDTGNGMTLAHKDRMFEPFFTTKRIGEGSGMGLAVVHGIVKKHHGFIEVESELNIGTIVRIFFPQLYEVMDEDVSWEENDIGKNKKVLLCEDDIDVLMSTKVMLEKIGCQVSHFANPREALFEFQSNPAAFDLVIVDQSMPVFKGTELIIRIKALREDIPAVVYTGFTEKIVKKQDRDMLYEILLKPVSLHDWKNFFRRFNRGIS